MDNNQNLRNTTRDYNDPEVRRVFFRIMRSMINHYSTGKYKEIRTKTNVVSYNTTNTHYRGGVLYKTETPHYTTSTEEIEDFSGEKEFFKQISQPWELVGFKYNKKTGELKPNKFFNTGIQPYISNNLLQNAPAGVNEAIINIFKDEEKFFPLYNVYYDIQIFEEFKYLMNKICNLYDRSTFFRKMESGDYKPLIAHEAIKNYIAARKNNLNHIEQYYLDHAIKVFTYFNKEQFLNSALRWSNTFNKNFFDDVRSFENIKPCINYICPELTELQNRKPNFKNSIMRDVTIPEIAPQPNIVYQQKHRVQIKPQSSTCTII